MPGAGGAQNNTGNNQRGQNLKEGAGGAAVSYHQPHQQAYLRQQLNQTRQALNQQFGRQNSGGSSTGPSPSKRPSRSTAGIVNYAGGDSSTEAGMVLDPSTGMMVPSGGGGGDDDDVLYDGQSSGAISRGRDGSNCTTKVCV